MAITTTSDSRQPSVSQIRIDTESTAMQHVEEQLVRFLRGGLAVVARDRDLDVARESACRAASRSSRSTARATSMAFVPLRLATEIVTAGDARRRAGR